MAHTLGIVEFNRAASAQSSASSLGALASRRFGNGSVLEWVSRRVSESQLIDKVMVVVGEGAHSELARQCTPANITLFVSAEKDPLARALSALTKYQADALVRVCVDNPFVDPVLIDRLIVAANQEDGCDYMGFCSTNETPLDRTCGMLADWCSADALHRAHQLAPADSRGDVSEYLRAQPNRFNVRWIPAPAELVEGDLRLKIDVEEDWEHAQVIYDALGPEFLDWQGITRLLDQQPAMRQRMAVLNRASA